MKTDWVTWVIQTLIGLGFAIIAYFWKKDQASLQARLEKVEERLDCHDKQFSNLPFVYVTKDDFIRAMSRVETSINENQQKTDTKLDKIYDLMLELKKEN
jgi:type I site-specific restriction endonuclease